ncbi:MAG: hypothetical protein RL341_958 [Pseudomonadota bacterium]
MSLRAIRWLTALLILAILLPAAAVLGWSYWDARRAVQNDMNHVASAARDRLDAIVASGSDQLQVLGNLTDTLAAGGCDNDVQSQLRDIVFRSPYFREAGVLYDNSLLCNQYERFEPPVDVAKRLKDAASVDGLLIAAQRVPDGGPHSLILAMRYYNRGTGYLIVHPAAMVDYLAFFEPNAQHGVYYVYDGRVALSTVGVIEDATADQLLASVSGSGERPGQQIFSVARSAKYPVAIAAVSNAHLAIDRWKQRLPWVVLLASLLAAGAYWVVRKLASQALSMHAELARAIASERLSVEYQPFFDAEKGIVAGVEVLARWNNRREGPLSPAVFVPLAEQMGLLPELTEFVMKRTLFEMEPLMRRFPRMRVSINCHVSTLSSPLLGEFLRRWSAAGLNADRLVFEVTERANAHFDAASVKAPMQALKAQGASFAMDDFGVGFSNLNSLRTLPFDFLKIDKAFVDGIAEGDAESAGFVDHIIALAKRLDLIVVAEGVETQAQRDYLRKAGVRYMQGWLFARPMTASAFTSYLGEYRQSAAPAQVLTTNPG